MRLTEISNLYIYITTMTLCMELCYSFWIERAQVDSIKFPKKQTCDVINSNRDNGACMCQNGVGYIASNKEKRIKCVDASSFKVVHNNEVSSKNTYLSYHCVFHIKILE